MKSRATVKYWRCCVTGCPSRMSTNSFDVKSKDPEIQVRGLSDHTHEDESNLINRQAILTKMRRTIREQPFMTARQAYDSVVSELNLPAGSAPEFNRVKQTLKREVRRTSVSQVNKSSSEGSSNVPRKKPDVRNTNSDVPLAARSIFGVSMNEGNDVKWELSMTEGGNSDLCLKPDNKDGNNIDFPYPKPDTKDGSCYGEISVTPNDKERHYCEISETPGSIEGGPIISFDTPDNREGSPGSYFDTPDDREEYHHYDDNDPVSQDGDYNERMPDLEVIYPNESHDESLVDSGLNYSRAYLESQHSDQNVNDEQPFVPSSCSVYPR